MANRDVRFHFARAKPRDADRSAHADGYRRIDFSDLRLQLVLNVPLAIGRRSPLVDDAVLFVPGRGMVAGNQGNGDLPSGEKLRLLAAGAHQPRLSQQTGVSVIGLKTGREIRAARHRGSSPVLSR